MIFREYGDAARFPKKDQTQDVHSMTITTTNIGQKKLPDGWKWEKLGDVCESWH